MLKTCVMRTTVLSGRDTSLQNGQTALEKLIIIPWRSYQSETKKQTLVLHHKWQYSNMEIKVPELSLIVLIGVSGSGKSSFAKKHFKRTEVLSSDECRALVSDDENNQSATTDAFDVLYYIAGKRLKSGLLTVIDATNVQKESRKGL